ncbi:MAG: ArsC/Spx/MgsR family protein [Azospirillaceae bacterium]|nr:ArsC/Spx/MgsR family protein [Azospirillaceae bacterium]
MAEIIFFEKPGCQGNARQKQLLRAAGHRIEARNLLSEPWTPATLRPFFGDRPVADWFNRNAPAVKDGTVVPERLDADAALALLIAQPLLIRRPLLQVGDRRETGFDAARIDAWIGLGQIPQQDLEQCRHAAGTPPCPPAPAATPSDAVPS